MKKILSPLMLSLLTLASVFAIVPLVHAQGSASVSTDQPSYAQDVGQTFTVAIQLSNVSPNVNGYDVTVNFDPTVLTAQSVDFMSMNTFIGPYCAASQCLQVATIVNQATGTVRGAFALLGAAPATPSGTVTLYTITFLVASAGNSLLPISAATISAFVGGSGESLSVSTSGSVFLLPPNLNFVAPNAAACASPVRHLFKGQTSIVLCGYIQLSPTDLASGFGSVVFNIVDPTGGIDQVSSTTGFMFPGNSTTVTGTFDFSSNPIIGTYHLSVTMLRCPLPTTCVTGATAAGNFFKVKA